MGPSHPSAEMLPSRSLVRLMTMAPTASQPQGCSTLSPKTLAGWTVVASTNARIWRARGAAHVLAANEIPFYEGVAKLWSQRRRHGRRCRKEIGAWVCGAQDFRSISATYVLISFTWSTYVLTMGSQRRRVPPPARARSPDPSARLTARPRARKRRRPPRRAAQLRPAWHAHRRLVPTPPLRWQAT